MQLRAAGALDENLPAEAREQLQIAALHQLRGFLRGDYHESFKRPAFELLLAGHAAAIHRIGIPAMQKAMENLKDPEIHNFRDHFLSKLNRVELARIAIIDEEADRIFVKEFPLENRRFDLLKLSFKTLPPGLSFYRSHFCAVDMTGATFHGAKFIFAQFEGAHLQNANLKGADLTCARFDNAILFRTNLLSANLEGARVSNATIIIDAKFDNQTIFSSSAGPNWNKLSEKDKNNAQGPWIERGMINVDAPPPDKGASG